MEAENWIEAKIARPEYCNFCEEEGNHVEATVDGATTEGPWAYMCDIHHKLNGRGLGLGKGQKLVVDTGNDK